MPQSRPVGPVGDSARSSSEEAGNIMLLMVVAASFAIALSLLAPAVVPVDNATRSADLEARPAAQATTWPGLEA